MTRVAIVTGASGGLGRALTHELVAHAWHVVAVTRHPEQILAHAQITVLRADVSSADDRQRILASARAAGELTAVINNAATAGGTPLLTLTPESLRGILDVNVVSAFALSRAALDDLERHRGIIVNISSIVGSIPTPYLAAYSASKHALNALTMTMALEWQARSIRTLLVEPGFLTSKLCIDSLEQSLSTGAASMKHATKKAAERHAVPVETAAKRIVRAMERERAFQRLPIGGWARILLVLHRYLPTLTLQRLLLSRYRVTQHASVPPKDGTAA